RPAGGSTSDRSPGRGASWGHIDRYRYIRQRIDHHRWKEVSREDRRSLLSAGLLLSGREGTGSPWLPVPSRSRAPVEHPLEGQAVRRRDLRRRRTVARRQDRLDRIRFETPPPDQHERPDER